MLKRAETLLAPFWRPETPLFVVGLLVGAVICLLVFIIIWSTSLKGLPGIETAFTLGNYTDVLSHPIFPKVALNTLGLGLGTVAVACFFAVPIAWLVHRTNVPLKKLFITLMFVHVLLPGFIRAMGWIMLLSPEIGIINQALRSFIPVETGPLSLYNLPFIMFLQGITLTPTLFLMLAGSFMAIDPSFEESAEICGSSRFQSLRRIALPLVKPTLVAGSIYIFMTGVSMFEVPALLGAPYNIHVFSTLMYDAVHPQIGNVRYGIAGVYGLLLLIPTVIALYYYQKMLKVSHRYTTVTGKGYRPKITDLGPWRHAGTAFIMFYYIIDLLLPFLAIVWISLIRYIQLPTMAALKTMSLAGYHGAIRILGEGGIIINTVQVVLSVAVLSVLISLIISWIIVRTRLPGRYALDTISMLPHAVPAIALAFSVAYFALLIVKILPLYGSVASIILADTMIRLPFTTRTINASLIQIHRELEDAVQICGGSRVIALRTVILPLITPALFYSFIWAALHAYRDVTVALFLQSPRNMVMSTVIWQQWMIGNSAEAAAIGVIMILIMAAVLLAVLKAFPQILGEMGA